MKPDHRITTLLLLCAVLLAGCATMSPVDKDSQAGPNIDPVDPYENINRKFYNFTDTLDRNILEPVANAYIEYLPNPLRRSIGNFYDNVGYPNVVLNAFLQGKVRQGFEDTLRFAVNSTIGLFGLFDMATPMGLVQHDEDFGQTLGVWGVNTGAYLYLPFHGPSSSRDISSIPIGMVTNALFYVSSAAIFAPIGVLGIIDRRARFSDAMIIRDQAALDPYLFVREASLQQRKHLIYDGNLPPESYADSLLDDPLEDASVPEGAAQNNPLEDRRADKPRSLQGDPARDRRIGGFMSLPPEGDGQKAGTGSASDDSSRTSSGRDPAIKTP
jgi:phospholipid-binding lipoprotein MlaA